MSEDIRKLLNHISDPNSKKVLREGQEAKKKPDIVDKEVLNLTKGLFPLQRIYPITGPSDKKNSKWVYAPIKTSKGDLSINHWVRQENRERIFEAEKFKIGPNLVTFTEDEYENHLSNLNPDWSSEETFYLWRLCEQYELRFIVIHDRYNFNNNSERSLEELKSRDEKSHPLFNYTFDMEYEKNRKFQLEKFLLRSKEKNEEEKRLMEEIKKLDNIIRKEEREQNSLQKIFNIQSSKDDEIDDKVLESSASIIQTQSSLLDHLPHCYLRGSVMHAALPVSAKVNKKLEIVLQELGVPAKPIPTAENESLYDELRKSILTLFSLHKHRNKKEKVHYKFLQKRQILYESAVNKKKNDKEESLEGSLTNGFANGNDSFDSKKRKLNLSDSKLKLNIKKLKTE